MQPLDYLVIAAISLIALWPLLLQGLGAARAAARRPAAPPIKERAGAGWRSGWVQTLMELQGVLESEGKNPEAIKLNRELIWLIIGGEP